MTAVLLLLFLAGASGRDPGVANSARYEGGGRYEWTVYLVGDKALLDSIDYVEYTLHPTFPQPKVTVKERRTRFALDSSGWGEFNIGVRVVYRDHHESYLKHWLSLDTRTK